jgi:putative transposase
MIIRKSFQYRLNPTKKQIRALQFQLDECRWLYNELLSQRKLAYEELDISISKYQQNMFLPLLKEERISLTQVHSQVLQNVVDRLDKGFQSFFRRCKGGEKPGFPRFRGANRYQSFCYPQSGFSVAGNELKLSKMGSIRIKLHRPIQGEIKCCTLRKTASGNWTVSFSCEMQAQPMPPREEAIGIDMGLENFATLSNAQVIENPRFFKQAEKALAKAQRKLCKLDKGTPERKKQVKIVAKVHERIGNQRKDFCHKASKKIVEHYQYICIEDLNIRKMMEDSHFSKSIADVSWRQFFQHLTYKAEEAGRKLRYVNPAYTTQDCYLCKHREEKKLNERMHCCSHCGYKASRDFNASQNILALGLDGLGVIPRSLRL